MCSTLLVCAEKDIAYFFWRAQKHQLSREDIEHSWQHLQRSLFAQCPHGLSDCADLKVLFRSYGSDYQRLITSTASPPPCQPGASP